MAHEGFGRAVNIAAGIRIVAGNRTDIDDIAALSFDHLRQDLTGQEGQTDDIGLNHGLPVGEIGFVGAVQTQSQSRVVNEAVDFFEAFGQALQRGRNGRGVGHIHLQRVKAAAQFFRKGL